MLKNSEATTSANRVIDANGKADAGKEPHQSQRKDAVHSFLPTVAVIRGIGR